MQAEAEQLKTRAEAEEQFELGEMYYSGDGVVKDLAQAARLVCARTCSWMIGRAGVTAARRQVEEADAWSCIAQVHCRALSLPLATHCDCAHGREH